MKSKINYKTQYKRLLILVFSINFLYNINYAQINSFKNYTINNGLSSNSVTSCIQDYDGYMWFCTDKGLNKFDGEEFIYIDLKKMNISNNEVIYSFKNDIKKEIWFFTIKGEFIKYVNHEFQLLPYISKYHKYFLFAGKVWYIDNNSIRNLLDDRIYYTTTNKNIYAIYEISDNRILINDTIYKKDNNNNLIVQKKIDFIYNYNENCIFSNFENTLLLNISQKNLDKNVFLINKDGEYNFTIPDIDIRNFIIHNNKIIMAGMRGGIYVYDLKTKTYEKHFTNSICINIYKDKDDNFWILTNYDGIYMLKFDEYMNTIERNIKFNFIKSAYPNILSGDNKGNFYVLDSLGNVLTNINYINNINYENIRTLNGFEFKKNYYLTSDIGFYKIVKNEPKFIYKLAVKQVASDTDNIFFSSNKELFKYDSKEVTKIFESNIIKQLYTYKNNVYVITEDTIYKIINNRLIFNEYFKNIEKGYSNGHIVVYQFNNGLIINNNNNKIRFDFSKFNLNSKIINICIFNDSTYFLATNNGIYKLSIKNGEFKLLHFNEESRLYSNLITGIDYFNNKLLLSSEKGISIQNISYFDTSFRYKYFKLNSNLKSDSTYVFNYNQEIKITLSTIYFSTNKAIKYEYYLINKSNSSKKIDKIISSEPTILYTSLQAGDYVLHIKAINSSDIYSNNELLLKFKVLPPFYQTWWFYTLIAIVILTIIGLLLFIYINKIRTNNNIMRLQSLSLQSQMNPHFIFNALNSINSFIYNNNKNEANAYLSKISHLIRKSLDHSTTKSITLYDEINLLKNYLEIEKMRFGDKLIYSINMDENINIEEIDVPPFFTQIMAENAIIHGISKIDSIGHIDIEFKLYKNYLKYIVSDNGNGLQIKYNKEHQSKGLKLLNQRIQLFNGNKDENIQIENRVDNENKVLGAISTLTLKINI